MKIRITALLLIVIFFSFGLNAFLHAQLNLKSSLTGLIELCKNKKYEDAVKSIAYYSDDKKKDFKAPDLNDKEQLNFVKRTAKRINALVSVSSSFTVGNPVSEKQNGVEFQNLLVEFISGSQKISSHFKFVIINNIPLLAEIE